jgi:RimJ/RimL family protein N-acetyltransferase
MPRERYPETVLRGERILLRPMREEDAEAVVRWRSDPAVRRWFFSTDPITIESHLAWFRREKPDRIDYVIVLMETERPIGTVSFIAIDRRTRTARDGTMIGEPALWGKGYGREALRLWLSFGFGRLGLRRIDAEVKSSNERSARMLERLGFSTTGRRRTEWGEEFLAMTLTRDEAERRGIVPPSGGRTS